MEIIRQNTKKADRKKKEGRKKKGRNKSPLKHFSGLIIYNSNKEFSVT